MRGNYSVKFVKNLDNEELKEYLTDVVNELEKDYPLGYLSTKSNDSLKYLLKLEIDLYRLSKECIKRGLIDG